MLLRRNAVDFGCSSKISSFEVYNCDRIGGGDADNVDVNGRLDRERPNCLFSIGLGPDRNNGANIDDANTDANINTLKVELKVIRTHSLKHLQNS